MIWVTAERKRSGYAQEPYQPSRIGRFLGKVEDAGVDEERLKAGYQHFLKDRYWRKNGACPLGGFISQWERMVEDAQETTFADPGERGWSSAPLQRLLERVGALRDEVACRKQNLSQKGCTCGKATQELAKWPSFMLGCGYCAVQHLGAEACLARLERVEIELIEAEAELMKKRKEANPGFRVEF
jgi:hypothetical protein